MLALNGSAAVDGAAIASFEDIDYWVGAGANRAAIVIDWESSSDADESLVWGFRWDGAARGDDMLLAVVNADPRLYLKRGGGGSFGFTTYGIGYDADNDGEFALSDGTQFDDDGVAVTGLPDEDATPVDADDWYREGWFTGAWAYGTASGVNWDELTWSQSFTGPHGRLLQNNSWDSWAFASPIVLSARANNPHAAAAPVSDEDADFDLDGDVDGSDFLAWQHGFGVSGAGRGDGDANGDGAVDGLDLEVWRGSFGDRAAAFSASAVAVPEPAVAILAASALLCLWVLYRNLEES